VFADASEITKTDATSAAVAATRWEIFDIATPQKMNSELKTEL
jgi:hypothetical protein